jgi:hypothetical protein
MICKKPQITTRKGVIRLTTQQGSYPVPRRATREQDDLIEDDSYYTTRPHTSTRRYVTTEGQQVIQRGNKRIVIHNEPPPNKRMHWSFTLGIGMLLALALWVGGSYVLSWWTNHELDTAYGMPRTYQTDQVVGHSDSADHPTHFIFINLNSHITVIELPGGNSSHARIYSGPTLYSDNGNQTPVIGEFQDVNGDGKIDMIIHIGDQRIIYLNDEVQFKPQQ